MRLPNFRNKYILYDSIFKLCIVVLPYQVDRDVIIIFQRLFHRVALRGRYQMSLQLQLSPLWDLTSVMNRSASETKWSQKVIYIHIFVYSYQIWWSAAILDEFSFYHDFVQRPWKCRSEADAELHESSCGNCSIPLYIFSAYLLLHSASSVINTIDISEHTYSTFIKFILEQDISTLSPRSSDVPEMPNRPISSLTNTTTGNRVVSISRLNRIIREILRIYHWPLSCRLDQQNNQCCRLRNGRSH